MLIRSQDKKSIVNLDNISEISSVNREIYSFSGRNHTQLGKYYTEEKAIKVLDMIQDAYRQYGTLTDGRGSVHGAFNLPKVFQMPQDEEVEV